MVSSKIKAIHGAPKVSNLRLKIASIRTKRAIKATTCTKSIQLNVGNSRKKSTILVINIMKIKIRLQMSQFEVCLSTDECIPQAIVIIKHRPQIINKIILCIKFSLIYIFLHFIIKQPDVALENY